MRVLMYVNSAFAGINLVVFFATGIILNLIIAAICALGAWSAWHLDNEKRK